MAHKAIINVNMFDLYQMVYLVDDNNKPVKSMSVLLGDLVNYVLYKEKDINEIEIDGNKNFIQKIGLDFLTECNKNYSNRNVRIILNGEVFNQ